MTKELRTPSQKKEFLERRIKEIEQDIRKWENYIIAKENIKKMKIEGYSFYMEYIGEMIFKKNDKDEYIKVRLLIPTFDFKKGKEDFMRNNSLNFEYWERRQKYLNEIKEEYKKY